MNFFDPSRPSSEMIMAALRVAKANDLPLHTGKTLAYVYEPDPEAYRLIQDAYMMYLTENGLDPTAFQSLLKMEQEVVRTALDLVGGDEGSAGNFTFGGTESIMLAVKAARDYARETRPEITKPNIVIPITAHAAFHKACHYLCIEVKIVPVDDQTYTTNLEDMEAEMDDQTIMVVASAPSYAHGVMDPVEDIAALAKSRGIWCHVDACVGGMYLPFAKRLGYDVPAFDLSVDGVTTLSMDFHKYGYTAKGASCILYKDREKRKYQIYTCADWSGYAVVNPTVLSSKSGGSLAACWANLKFLGAKGYEDIVTGTQSAAKRISKYITDSQHLRLLGSPVMNMISLTSEEIDLFRLVQQMKDKGWYIQLQFAHENSPTNIHLSINRANVEHIDTFLSDLSQAIQAQLDHPQDASLPIPIEMLAQLTPDMLDQMKDMLAINDGEAPTDMTLVNRILDIVPPSVRKMLLTEFMNGMMG